MYCRFNSYSTFITNIFNKLSTEQYTPLKNDGVFPTSQHVQDFSFGEISKIIRSLDVNKAHGDDDISVTMIKICDNSLVTVITVIHWLRSLAHCYGHY